MKILQVGKFYPIRGGVEKVMYDLTVGLSEQGIRCDMLCASTEKYPSGTIKLNNRAKIFVMPTSIKVASTMLAPSMIFKLRRIAKKYDIIHIHHPDPMACLSLFLSGYKGKVVLHWHSDIVKQKRLLQLYKPLQDWLIRRADIILGTTPIYVSASDFLLNVQTKVDFVPIGVDPIVAEERLCQRIRARYPGNLIFSLGRLVEYKGYEYLIRAAQYLDDNYHIVIGGKGPLRESLERLILELGVERRVTLLGYVPDEEIAAYFKTADLFCLSSTQKTEAFGIVQIEAMSCGTPVVSTAIAGSGVSWVNAHWESGLIVEPEQPQSLADAFRTISGNPDFRAALAIGAKQRYLGNFTTDIMVNKTRKIYQKILGLDVGDELLYPMAEKGLSAALKEVDCLNNTQG